MRQNWKVVTTLAGLIVIGGGLLACSPMAAQDEFPGLDVGAAAPNFTLPDQNGEATTLKELLEDQNVALVFYRSASW